MGGLSCVQTMHTYTHVVTTQNIEANSAIIKKKIELEAEVRWHVPWDMVEDDIRGEKSALGGARNWKK